LARAMHPVPVDAEALVYALKELEASTESLYGIKCTLKCDKPVPVKDNNIANHLFRIAQEAIRNAAKHARPRNIDVVLKDSTKWLTLEVRDDGVGIELSKLAQTHGVGLRIMKYRSQMIGATLDIRRREGGGTVVTCKLKHSGKEDQDPSNDRCADSSDRAAVRRKFAGAQTGDDQ